MVLVAMAAAPLRFVAPPVHQSDYWAAIDRVPFPGRIRQGLPASAVAAGLAAGASETIRASWHG